MAICQNTLFDLLRNSFLIPYRFNADGRTNPIIMTDESGNLLPGYKTTVREKITSIFMMSTVILTIRKIFILHRPTVTAMPMLLKKWIWNSRFWKKYRCTDHPRAARHCQAERDRGRSLFCCLGSYDQTGEKSSYGVYFLWAGFSGRGKHPL